MSRPRRTTEFGEDLYEDGGFLNKRQTRAQVRGTVTPSPMPGRASAARQNRLAQPICLERDRNTLLGVPANASKVTPMRHRVPSAERPALLHNDKKWVQEKTQQICEYLQEMLPANAIPGLSPDFFSRNTLRQISTKQFVGIVNFFFSHIWRNRTTIGNNHVEDIMSTLQKLNYPYQVNKSWLMTPMTQHSFGHVIVLLDFLKDFAPPSLSMQMSDCHLSQFPFMEKTEFPSYIHNTTDSIALSTTQAGILLDEEVTAQLFADAAEGFMLWNKMEECPQLHRKTGNMMISKRCDLPNIEALDADIEAQRAQLEEMEKQSTKLVDKKKEKSLQKLRGKEQNLKAELDSIRRSTAASREESDELLANSKHIKSEIEMMCAQQAQLQQQVSQQKCTLQQFEGMKFKQSDLEYELEMYERQVRELTDRGLSQQVMLSRAKKQLMDKVEQFNTIVRELYYSGICSANEADSLELAAAPKPTDTKQRIKAIGKLSALLAKRKAQHDERRKQLEESKMDMVKAKMQLESELNALNMQVKAFETQVAAFEASRKTKRAMWEQHQQELHEKQAELAIKLECLERQRLEHLETKANKERQNNEFLCETERRHAALMETQTAELDAYEKLLDEGETELQALNVSLEHNAVQLLNIKRILNETQLPDIVSEVEQHLQYAAKSETDTDI